MVAGSEGILEGTNDAPPKIPFSLQAELQSWSEPSTHLTWSGPVKPNLDKRFGFGREATRRADGVFGHFPLKISGWAGSQHRDKPSLGLARHRVTAE